MVKKKFDLKRIQELTERSRKRVDRKEEEKRLSEQRENEIQAKEYSDRVIAYLPDVINKEAVKGNYSLDLFLLHHGHEIQNRVEDNISGWCRARGLLAEITEVRLSDDTPPEKILVISWLKKMK